MGGLLGQRHLDYRPVVAHKLIRHIPSHYDHEEQY